MRVHRLAAAGLFGLAACAELFGPRSQSVSLTIVPVFDAADPYRAAASTADSLRIIILRDSAGIFQDTAAKATAAIDSTGAVNTTISVTLLESPTTFRIVLQALRSADGLIVFAGEDTVIVTAASSSGEGQQVEIPIVYTGPRAKTIVLAPRDTAMTGAGAFVYRVTAYDSVGGVVSGVVTTFHLVRPADSAKLIVNRLTGLVTAVSGATGEVRVFARTADSGAYDTARVFLGSVPSGVRITPGLARIAAGDTLTFAGQVLDPIGNPIAGTVTWASRNSAVATVNASGRVTGVAAGSAVVVASGSGGVGDSVLVTVVPATHAVMAASSSGRTFRVARVGDTVVVDLAADFRYTPPEKLGSFLATVKWNAAQLQFIDVQAADFGTPVTNVFADSLNLSNAQASSNPGSLPSVMVAARVRYRALATGATPVTLLIKELSSAVPPLFVNLLQANRVTVTSASVTVRP